MKKRYFIYLGVIAVLFSACEDKIDLDLDEGRSQLVVDAFLTSDSSIQTVRLTKSAAYFSNVRTPAENNAVVKIEGPAGKEFSFVSDNNGNFQYDPKTNGALDSVGFDYKLKLEYKGATYISYSKLNPVPVIDSMSVEFEEAEIGAEEGYYTQFYARDFAGRKDYYWIKAFRNGEPLYPEDPTLINLSEDAAFSGDGADGFVFILPIRAAITDPEYPFLLGEKSGVELWSLNSAVFEYLEQLTIQANNGGLFSTPPANIRSNIYDAAGGLQEEVLGVFSLSSVSKSEISIQ